MHEMSAMLAQHSLVLVFAAVFVAQIGIPIPAVPVLIVAGAFVAGGALHLAPLLAVAVAASLLGDTPWYVAGRRYGYGVLRTLCRIAIEPDSCVTQTENIFERWGAPSLMVAKFVPGFATIAPPLAGTMGLSLPRFLAFSTVGALGWALAPVLAGMVFHAEVEWALDRLDSLGIGVVALFGAIVGLYAGVKSLERYLLIRLLRSVRVTAGTLREMLRAADPPLVLDARSAMARRLDPRAIPGAIAVDVAAPEARISEMRRDRDVVVYCS